MILGRLVALVIGYVMGNFQTGYLYGKSKGIDIRTCGSGNAGTTNTLRTLGVKAGLITFLGDCFKAVLAIVIVNLIFGKQYPEQIKLLEMYAGFGTVLGHNFPCYLGFKGGKGIACTAGVIIAVCPVAAILCLLVFIAIVAATRYVSLGSIIMISVFLAQVIVFNHLGLLNLPKDNQAVIMEFDIVAACFTIMGIWRHRANIKRLLTGTENKFSMSKK
ncbi:glycerol-3-phosphate acyltransferase PlsY [Lachnospiraceae bacterium C7]|nr:glycerol-3-phosphate acyltransferase PlsY [Lachnospiraceae bacterium C7]